MNLDITKGDILDQKSDVIVNSWNRNIFPWWLLIPQGVSGAIKKKAGIDPFRELSKMGLIPLGKAVLTGAGKLDYKGIIHVAGINLLWTGTEYSIRNSVVNAMKIAEEKGFKSIAFPVIGSGSGRFKPEVASRIMIEEFDKIDFEGNVVLVQFE